MKYLMTLLAFFALTSCSQNSNADSTETVTTEEVVDEQTEEKVTVIETETDAIIEEAEELEKELDQLLEEI